MTETKDPTDAAPAVVVADAIPSVSSAVVAKLEDKAKAPNPKCKKCYGRGHIGKDQVHGGNIPCRCTYSTNQEEVYQQQLRRIENTKQLSRK